VGILIAGVVGLPKGIGSVSFVAHGLMIAVLTSLRMVRGIGLSSRLRYWLLRKRSGCIGKAMPGSMKMAVSKVNVGRAPTAARLDYRRRLAVCWIEKHRPDVMEAIEVEVEAKYPLVIRKAAKTVLPETLVLLK